MKAPALVFDLDGTLVDSVYQHVLAWSTALQEVGLELSVWRIHRRIGMSGGLVAHALLREAGKDLDEALLRRLQEIHTDVYLRSTGSIRVLPGSVQLLNHLTALGIPWGIATSGRSNTAEPALKLLPIPASVPVVTRSDVLRAKPDPDLFLDTARRLGAEPEDVVIVGDSIWDLLAARRARSLGVGLLSGGYGSEELQAAGAYRVYDDPLELFNHLDEIGVRS